jgi:chitinase
VPAASQVIGQSSSSSTVPSYPTSSPAQYSLSFTSTASPSSPDSSSTSTKPTAVPEPAEPAHNGYRAVAYYGNWDVYARNFSPPQIPADRLTHLLYSFADNKADGTVFLTDTYADTDKHNANDSWNDQGNNVYGSIKQLQILKASNRNLKVILSVGGWTYTNTNTHMDMPMATATGRQKFARSCVQMIKDYGFDGIDVDWEYPQNTEQGSQFLALLKEIRNQMDEYAATLMFGNEYGQEMKPNFLLSIAAPAGEKNYRNLPLQQISQVTDFINLMVSTNRRKGERWDGNSHERRHTTTPALGITTQATPPIYTPPLQTHSAHHSTRHPCSQPTSPQVSSLQS